MTGIGRLKSYLPRYWRRYLLGALCLFGTATLIMLIPWWIRQGVRILEQGGAIEEVTFYALIIGAAAILQGITRTFSRFLIFNAARDIEYDIRNDLFGHLQKLPLSYYHSQKTGDLMSRLINDISAVRMLLGPGFLNLVNAPLYYFYAMVLMFSMDARVTLVALLPYPILIWAVRSFRGRVLRTSLRVQQQMAELSSHIQENLSGMHVVRAYAQEQYQIAEFGRLNEEYQRRGMELAVLRGRVEPFMKLINGSTILVVIWYGGVRVVRGDLMVADLVAFIAYLNTLAWPTAAFGWTLSLLERGRAAMERLEEIFKVEPEIVNPLAPRPLNKFKEGIEFRDVWFVYGSQINGQGILKDVSFALPRGKTLAIVGRTGAGKSSLAQLVPRLYDVSSGEVRIDGKDIRTLPLSELRRMIGYVPQDPFLFSAPLRRNLSFGREEVSDAELEKAIRIAGLDRDIEAFPQGLDTLVGERGITLSGGQKQRATLARALLMDPPVLILDDCLSSVDAETEQRILSGLKEVLKEKTCILVSHRISAVRNADKILVVDEGRIVEQGDHQTLIREGGLYAELFHRQQLSEELDHI
jgi:ATP-binding cassette subfamily B multidrug efflux pump